MKWANPPKIKILEATGAIADGRVSFIDDNSAKVVSSSGDKTYTVKFDLKNKKITSDDNGSMFKGYLGYPSISVLMLKNILPFSEKISRALKGIKWKELNEKYKAYWKTEFVVKKIAERKGVDPSEIDNYVNAVLEKIKECQFERLD